MTAKNALREHVWVWQVVRPEPALGEKGPAKHWLRGKLKCTRSSGPKGNIFLEKKRMMVCVLMKYAVLQNLSFNSHSFSLVLKQGIT